MLMLALCLTAAASSYDFEAEAEQRMKLSFDLDEVEGMLAAPAAAAPVMSSVGWIPQAALPLEPNSSVSTVTVFRDRALVTRERTVSLPAGPASVTFEGLPLGMANEGLYASIEAGGARVIGVERLSGAGEVEESDRIEEIREELRALTAELGTVRDRMEGLLAQRVYLRETLLVAPPDGQPMPSLAQVEGGLTFVGDAERRIAREMREQEEQASELDESLRPLLIKLGDPLATGVTVRVDLDVQAAGPVTAALSYQSTGAGWTPAYNARLDPDAGRVDLEYYGIVAQSTGEDWDDAELLLSTASPSTSGQIPRLTSWYLGRDGYGAVGGLMANRGAYDTPDNAMGNAMGGLASGTAGGLVDSQMSASVAGSGVVVFAIPGARTVPGDGSEQRLPVGVQTFEVETELACVPRIQPEVFRRGRLRYAGEAPLLPGPISTFVGADYVGSGSLDAVVPGEELLLSFGVDDRVKVERTMLTRNQEHLGAMRRTVRYTLHFRTTVKNFGDQPATVQIVDQVPISEIDRVTVKTLETTAPLPTDPADGPGILKWQPTIAAGGEAVIDLRFSVTAPTEVAEAQLQSLEMLF